MSDLTHCNHSTRKSIGNGEVVSSILTGSTTKAHGIRASVERAFCRSATLSRTYTKLGNIRRGKSVDFVHGMSVLGALMMQYLPHIDFAQVRQSSGR